jgi:hypothetical protein
MACKCCQCGDCCSNMSLVHSVTEQISDYEFIIYNHYSGDIKKVQIDPDKIQLFEEQDILETMPEACPFLRFNQNDGKAYCTVHLTRPDICREFCCWRLVILDSHNKRAGRILYQRTFVSDDENLTKLWDQSIRPIKEPDDTVWEEKVIRILTRAGYTVRD